MVCKIASRCFDVTFVSFTHCSSEYHFIYNDIYRNVYCVNRFNCVKIMRFITMKTINEETNANLCQILDVNGKRLIQLIYQLKFDSDVCLVAFCKKYQYLVIFSSIHQIDTKYTWHDKSHCSSHRILMGTNRFCSIEICIFHFVYSRCFNFLRKTTTISTTKNECAVNYVIDIKFRFDFRSIMWAHLKRTITD